MVKHCPTDWPDLRDAEDADRAHEELDRLAEMEPRKVLTRQQQLHASRLARALFAYTGRDGDYVPSSS